MAGKVIVKNIEKGFANSYWNKRGAVGRSKGLVLSIVRGAQRKARNDLDSHPVTKELSAGAGGSNISGTIRYQKHRGDEKEPNLYTLIGFPNGYDPVRDLRKLFDQPIEVKYKKSKTSSRGTFSHIFTVNLPDEDIVYRVTPMPDWAGAKSWVKSIENGDLLDDSINYYLAIGSDRSRSGGGIQVKVAYKNIARDFNHTPYVTKILDDLVARIQSKISRSSATR